MEGVAAAVSSVLAGGGMMLSFSWFAGCEIPNRKEDAIIEMPEEWIELNSYIKIGDNVSFGIRPEEINLINEKIENSLELTIDEINFKGSVSTVNLISEHSKQKIKIQNIVLPILVCFFIVWENVFHRIEN